MIKCVGVADTAREGEILLKNNTLQKFKYIFPTFLIVFFIRSCIFITQPDITGDTEIISK